MTARTLAAALLPALLAACARPPAAAGQGGAGTATAPVQTVVATEEPVIRTLAVTGTLRANQDSDVAANVSGRVTRTFVERGTRLAENRPLVELDLRRSALDADEARANLEAAKAEKTRADGDCQRNQRLFEKGAITQQELERTTAECLTTAESLAAAESRARRANDAVADGVVRTPFAGIVSERFVNVGEYVQPGTKVAHVVQLDPLRLELTLPEAHVGAIRQGLAVEFEVAALPGRTFRGTVAYVSPSLRVSTRDLVFEAVVPNADGALKAGMFASARIATGTERLPVVPRSALRDDGETVRAFVVKDGRIEERVVQPGAALGDRTAIRAGVAAGEQLVVQPASTISDGMAVR